MRPLDRDATVFHVVAFTIGAAVLLVRPGLPVGALLVVLVLMYAVASPAAAGARGHARWGDAWRFATVLSVLQVVPDWVLVDGLGTLAFEPAGAPSIGPVPVHMAGLWAPALVPLLLLGDRQRPHGWFRAGVVVAAATLVLFAAAEAVLPRLPTWRAIGVTTVGTVAVYVVPAEVALGVAAHHVYGQVRDRGIVLQTAGAAVVATFYTGALAVSWLVVEQAGPAIIR